MPLNPKEITREFLKISLVKNSLCTRVAPAALAKEKTGVRPNGLGSDRRMGWIALCRDGLPEG